MLYLSQMLDKQLWQKETPYGKVVDLVAKEEERVPVITQLIVKKAGKKLAIDARKVKFSNKRWELESAPQELPYSDKEFLLNEDLLDKQVIDVNGRRLVRVNDLLLKENGVFKIEGIDISFAGILRRLGISDLFTGRAIILPWSVIEAFDYQTGNIKIKLTQSSLNTFHPAEIADILEEVGTKERLGILESLDARKAASAIEEADEETQTAILEQVPQQVLQKIINRMHLSEIADVIHDINPFRSNQIFTMLGMDKVGKLQRLLHYKDNVAGGLMDPFFVKLDQNMSVKEVLARFKDDSLQPESTIIVDDNNQYVGVINARKYINVSPNSHLYEILGYTHAVTQDTHFPEILRIFTQYNLRVLPVVDSEKKVLGVIKIDSILSLMLEEEEEKKDAF